MDRRERTEDINTAMRVAITGALADVWTCLPGTIQEFDAATCSAKVQPTVKAQTQNKTTGVWTDVNLPLLLDVPVHFPSGGGATLTFPLKKDDEVLVVFGSRCVNAWWTQGGIQPQEEFRMHDLSDGFCIPKVWSKPNVPANISTTKTELRSDDHVARVSLDPVAHTIEVIAPGGIFLTGPLVINGVGVTFPGAGVIRFGAAVESIGSVTALAGSGGSVTLDTHTHPGNNQPPTPGT